MKYIKASYTWAIVDDEDYERLAKFNWHIVTGPRGNARYAYNPDNGIKQMHRRVLDINKEIDHINGEGLDNRKINLRVVTRRQNSYNRIGRVGRRYKGVSRHRGRWRAYIAPEYKQIHLGVFDTEEMAAHAYDLGALLYFGKEYARLNFPVST